MIWNVKYHKNVHHNIFGANYFDEFQQQKQEGFLCIHKIYFFVHNWPDILKNCTNRITKKTILVSIKTVESLRQC